MYAMIGMSVANHTPLVRVLLSLWRHWLLPKKAFGVCPLKSLYRCHQITPPTSSRLSIRNSTSDPPTPAHPRSPDAPRAAEPSQSEPRAPRSLLAPAATTAAFSGANSDRKGEALFYTHTHYIGKEPTRHPYFYFSGKCFQASPETN